MTEEEIGPFRAQPWLNLNDSTRQEITGAAGTISAWHLSWTATRVELFLKHRSASEALWAVYCNHEDSLRHQLVRVGRAAEIDSAPPFALPTVVVWDPTVGSLQAVITDVRVGDDGMLEWTFRSMMP